MKNIPLTRRTFLRYVSAASLVAGASTALPGISLAVAPNASDFYQETKLLMGTFVTISAYGVPEGKAAEAANAAFIEMERLVTIFDRRTTSSILGELNSAGKIDNAPGEFLTVFDQAKRLYTASGTFFNPAIGPVIALLEAHKNSSGAVRFSQSEMKEALDLSNFQAVASDGKKFVLGRNGMALSFDGIAKGYIADQASLVLERLGVYNHMVNAGGDIRTSGLRGTAFWRIGVENPARKNTAMQTIRLAGQALATSGGYAAPYSADGARHHLVNPFTGDSPRILSASVVAKNAVVADALATALAVLPPHQGKALAETYNAECSILTPQGQSYKTAGWKKLLG